MNSKKSIRVLLAAASVLAMTAAAPVVMAKTAPHAAPKPAPAQAAKPGAPAWPQDISDLAVDPAVKFGVLANGMHYAIRHNETPKGEVSVRFRVDAGSLDEHDDQQGLAHFIEHMAFNGSQNVKPDEFVKKLELYGLAFGADTNASTSFDQTIYQLDTPKNDAEIVDYMLFLMRETAGRLSFIPQEIEKERGVVLGEERLRDSPGLRLVKAQLHDVYKGLRAPDRFPIGLTDILKTAQQDKFLDLYHRGYRPERAILVVTGDIDPAAIEAAIKAKFGDWRGEGPVPARVDLGKVDPTPFAADYFYEANAINQLAVSVLKPYEKRPDNSAERKKDTIRSIAYAVVNQRFQDLIRKGDSPLLGAQVGGGDFLKSAETYGFTAGYKPGQWQAALTLGEQEIRRAATFGFTQAEIDRVIADSRSGLEAAVKGADTRQTRALANGLIGAFANDNVFTTPQTELAQFNAAVAGLTPDAVQKAFQEAFSGGVRRVFVGGNQPVENGAAAVEKAYRDSAAVPVVKAAEEKAAAFDYSFGPAGKVAMRKAIDDLGVTLVQFENGVKLNIRPSDVEKDRVQIRVRFGDGLYALPGALNGLQNFFAPAVIDGGLGKLDASALDRALTGHQVGTRFASGLASFQFDGVSTKTDFTLEMSLLAARLTDPGFRAQGVDQAKAALDTTYQQIDANAMFVGNVRLGGFLRSNDPRFAFPTLDTQKKWTVGDAKAFLGPILANAPLEVTIVGDVSLDDAIAATAATFGALPKRDKAPALAPNAFDLKFPAGGTVAKVDHGGRADQAYGVIAWKATDSLDRAEAARLSVLQAVLGDKAIEVLREEQGATYSPQAIGFFSEQSKGFGYLGIAIETPVDKVASFVTTADKIAQGLGAAPLTDDDLARAKRPLIERVKTARKGNGYWLNALADVQTQSDRLDQIRNQLPLLDAVTAADIQATARKYLSKDREAQMIVTPRAAK